MGLDTVDGKRLSGEKSFLIDALILLIVTFLVYVQALGNGFLSTWDDPEYVLLNEAIRGFSLSHLRTAFTEFFVGNYAPAQIISYMLDYTLWGMNARGFIATNIMLHAVNGVLLYLLASKLRIGRLGALFAACLFLVHPVQVETVAWISQRKTLLSMTFFLLALICYIRFKVMGDKRGYLASIASFCISLLAKSVAVILPIGLVSYDWWCHPRSERRGVWLNKVPFLLVALAVGGVALISQDPETGRGGGRDSYHGGTPFATFLTMLPVFVRYLRMLVWPSGLSAIYDPPIKHGVDGHVLLAATVLTAVGAAFLYLGRLQRENRFWIALIIVGILPVSQIVPINTLMNDRYLYFPLLGFAGLCGSLVTTLHVSAPRLERVLLGAGAIVLAVWAVLSFQRTAVWNNSVSLWSDAVRKTPASYKAWGLLGSAYQKEGRFEEALSAYDSSLALRPFNPELLNDMAVLYMDKGEPLTGRSILTRLLEAVPTNAGALFNLGNNYLMTGELDEAERCYRAAGKLNGNDPKIAANLAGIQLIRGNVVRADELYRQARSAGMDELNIEYRLAGILARAGRSGEALAHLEKAVGAGFSDRTLLEKDADFAPLRKHPRYGIIIAGMREMAN